MITDRQTGSKKVHLHACVSIVKMSKTAELKKKEMCKLLWNAYSNKQVPHFKLIRQLCRRHKQDNLIFSPFFIFFWNDEDSLRVFNAVFMINPHTEHTKYEKTCLLFVDCFVAGTVILSQNSDH